MEEEEEYGINWVADVIENEGLGYALTSYLNLNNIKDMNLMKLCKDARKSMRDVETYIDKNTRRR